MMRTFLQTQPMAEQSFFPQATSCSAVKKPLATTKGSLIPSDSFERSTSITTVSTPPPSSPIRSGWKFKVPLNMKFPYSPLYNEIIQKSVAYELQQLGPLVSQVFTEHPNESNKWIPTLAQLLRDLEQNSHFSDSISDKKILQECLGYSLDSPVLARLEQHLRQTLPKEKLTYIDSFMNRLLPSCAFEMTNVDDLLSAPILNQIKKNQFLEDGLCQLLISNIGGILEKSEPVGGENNPNALSVKFRHNDSSFELNAVEIIVFEAMEHIENLPENVFGTVALKGNEPDPLCINGILIPQPQHAVTYQLPTPKPIFSLAEAIEVVKRRDALQLEIKTFLLEVFPWLKDSPPEIVPETVEDLGGTYFFSQLYRFHSIWLGEKRDR